MRDKKNKQTNGNLTCQTMLKMHQQKQSNFDIWKLCACTHPLSCRAWMDFVLLRCFVTHQVITKKSNSFPFCNSFAIWIRHGHSYLINDYQPSLLARIDAHEFKINLSLLNLIACHPTNQNCIYNLFWDIHTIIWKLKWSRQDEMLATDLFSQN